LRTRKNPSTAGLESNTDERTSLCQWGAVTATGTTTTHSMESAMAFLMKCRMSGGGGYA
jgi:hypothetical protein